MRVAMRAALAAAAVVALAACGSAAAPVASGQRPHNGATRPESLASRPSANPSGARPAAQIASPPAGTRPEAIALARKLLSKLHLPAGSRRLPPEPVPPPLRQPSLWGLATASLDVHRLFGLARPMASVAAMLTAHVPADMSLAGTGNSGGPAGVTSEIVSYTARSVPTGVNAAQLALTVVPDGPRGSLVRADAQVIWYPPRTAAEYIDPARYHVLTVAVTVFSPRLHTIRQIVMSPPLIAHLVAVLDRSRVNPGMTIGCPVGYAEYRLAFAVSRNSLPVVVVTASRSGCEGVQLRVDGRAQPSLQDTEARHRRG